VHDTLDHQIEDGEADGADVIPFEAPAAAG